MVDIIVSHLLNILDIFVYGVAASSMVRYIPASGKSSKDLYRC